MVMTSLKIKMLELFRMRMYFFVGGVALVFFVLLFQLINLQLLKGKEYKMKSKMNMESYIPIPAPRGEIYDRNFIPGSKNVVIVSNRPSFNVTTIPANFKKKGDLQKTLRLLSRFSSISFDDVMDDVNESNPWERIIIKEDIDFDTIVKLASHEDKFPNITWEDATVRVYNFKNMFSHIIGYTGSISRKEYKRLKKFGYKHYQKIGKAGLENEYDTILRGVDGYVRRIVGVRSRIEGEEIGLQPVAGSNLVLSVDFEIQKAAYDAIADKNGAVIVIKPSTGEIISLVSKPDFDPNLIISKDNIKVIEELQNNSERPFLNRAIQSRYPPASTFKLNTAIAALEEERWQPEKTLHCPGKYTLKGYIDRDFYCYAYHGFVNLEWAIAKSCSVYFYQLGYKIGPTIILKYANYFGLNEKTGIDLPGEISGFLPSKKWKLQTFGQSWFDGDTLNLSIGQGFIAITPIEMASFICGIVNNGVIYIPHLIKEIRTPDNRLIRVQKPEKIKEIPLSPLTLKSVKNGMRLSVRSGTSARLSGLKIAIAGKTGTAQTRSKRLDKFTQHAWFVGYAPFDGPVDRTVVVVVLIEYGIAGAATAVPVAERIFARLMSLGYF
jgi:penicillin-binding protein 2